MFSYWYKTFYNLDWLMIGQVFVVVDGESFEIKRFQGYNPADVHYDCAMYVLDKDDL